MRDVCDAQMKSGGVLRPLRTLPATKMATVMNK